MAGGSSRRDLLGDDDENGGSAKINVKVVRFSDGDADAGSKVHMERTLSEGTSNSLSMRDRLQRVGPAAFSSARRSLQRLTGIISADTIQLTGHWWKFTEVLDPRSRTVIGWQKIFLASCFVGIWVDPLFFFLPVIITNEENGLMRVDLQMDFSIVITVVRTFVDLFYLVNIFMQFRIAYIAPSTRTFGRGDLVLDKKLIRARYLRRKLLLDVIAVLPLPQVTLWGYFYRRGERAKTKNVLRWLVLFQYFPRLYRIMSIWKDLQKTAGIVATTAWAGAFLNLLLYLLFSHVISSFYYALGVERYHFCWRKKCSRGTRTPPWGQDSYNCTAKSCDPSGPEPGVDLGIYLSLLQKRVPEGRILMRYLWTFWWGLQSLSSIGQGLAPSTYTGEVLFCIFIAIMGLTLFALLIGNIQTYLASVSLRLEEMRLKRRDTERWMQHRSVPTELRERVRQYDSLKWLATNGVDEEGLMAEWPADLRRDVKRHLCLDLVRKVPLFEDMEDESLLDAICTYLQPALFTEGTIALRDEDPVRCMYFVIRGSLKTTAVDSLGRSGFCNSEKLGPGSFFGDELLTWALDPNPREVLPLSNRLIETKTEVECFALLAGDLKSVASQYRRRLHSKKLQHVFRFHSHHWRTWAARCIQAAWRRYRKRKLMQGTLDDLLYSSAPDAAMDDWPLPQLVKPDEPDFSHAGAEEAEAGEEEYGTYLSAQATPRVGVKHQANMFSTKSGPVDMWPSSSAMVSGPLDGGGRMPGWAGRRYGRNVRRRGVGGGEMDNQDDDDGVQVGLTGPL